MRDSTPVELYNIGGKSGEPGDVAKSSRIVAPVRALQDAVITLRGELCRSRQAETGIGCPDWF